MSSSPPKVLIFGTGSVGSIYASILLRASCAVTAVCRSTYPIVSTTGITLKSAKWGTSTFHPTHVVSSVRDAAAHGPFDYILVTSKAFPGNAGLIRDAVGRETTIVLAQNGIDIEAEYKEAFPDNVLVSGIVWLPATQYEPGVVIHSYPLERLEIGTYPEDAPAEVRARVAELVELFAAGGATAVQCEDVQRQRWAKIAVNASMNPICALACCDDANLFRSGERSVGIVRDVQLEVASVAEAAGYPGVVTREGIEERMKMYTERLEGGGKEPSMLVDVRFDRPMEVEVIVGNVVRRAEKEGVKVPLLNMLYVLATARNSAILKDERWKPVNMMG